MPTGTGKTVSLLSLITSYLIAYPESFKKVLRNRKIRISNLSKLIYCTRTVPQMEKTLNEVRFVFESMLKEEGAKPKVPRNQMYF